MKEIMSFLDIINTKLVKINQTISWKIDIRSQTFLFNNIMVFFFFFTNFESWNPQDWENLHKYGRTLSKMLKF